MDSFATTVDAGHERVLAFDVGGAPFACRLGSVREILPLPPLTPLPGAPPGILGVVAVRGRVIAVLDGADRWGGDGGADAMLLVLEHRGRWLGVRCGEVDRVVVAPTARAVALGGECFEVTGTQGPARRLVDAAILVHSVLQDRGDVSRESDRPDL
jgi:chemotaxis signal transduction protein